MAVTLAPPRVRAMVVPDPAAWAIAGVDLAAEGIEPAWSPAQLDALVLASRVPKPLADAVHEVWLRLPDRGAVRIVDGLEIEGVPAEEVARESFRGRDSNGDYEDESHRGEDEDDHGGGHDHEDMMSVSGEPSADGLVMEDADAVVGPLSASLPTGLVLRAGLDGDVVCRARIEAPGISSAGGAVDSLCPSACRWALERAESSPPLAPRRTALRLAAVEVERALSHVMWLGRFARLLGWLELADRLEGAAGPLIAIQGRFARGEAPGEVPIPAELERELAGAIGSGRLRRRAHGLGVVERDACRERRTGGPLSRACGLDDDVRSADPAYRTLGFSPVLRDAGDAEARAELRAEEALDSLRLASAALAAGELPPVEGGPVEGPRGPVVAAAAGPNGAATATVPSARAAIVLAEEAAIGRELARALVAVASFDLSPRAAGR